MKLRCYVTVSVVSDSEPSSNFRFQTFSLRTAKGRVCLVLRRVWRSAAPPGGYNEQLLDSLVRS